MEEEVLDIWGTPAVTLGSKMGMFKQYVKKSTTNVKQVVLPQGGHSYNPSAKDHKEVINKVISEEVRLLEAEKRRLKFREPTPVSATAPAEKPAEDQDEVDVESDDSDAIGLELTNKAVDRGDKMNRAKLNRKKQLKQIDDDRKRVKEEKKFKN